ncbi:malectin-A-like [Macrobrachium nipponense]|uniref:malectin-A-like n=1 Tax=Macrobrachium nipponense TaxID=159736 RepID=UPI0030C7DAA5
MGHVIYAVNAGGNAHIDTFGIMYERDPLEGKIGTASDFGRRILIRDVPIADQVLYQTERFHHSTFGYDIPLKGDGEYILVLKFCEVYFDAPGKKVFDVVLNGGMKVLPGLDIFSRVGRGVACDEHVPFTIVGNSVFVAGRESVLRSNTLRVEFAKGLKDNPKVNALFVMKIKMDEFLNLVFPGRNDLITSLQELKTILGSIIDKNINSFENKDGELKGVKYQLLEDEPSDMKRLSKDKPGSGTKNFDPYEADTSYIIPILTALGAMVPLIFHFCRI